MQVILNFTCQCLVCLRVLYRNSSTPSGAAHAASTSDVHPYRAPSSSTQPTTSTELDTDPIVPSDSVSTGKRLPLQSSQRCLKSLKRTPKQKAFTMNDMVKLQMRQLQVERERLSVEKQKLVCLEGINSELATLKFLYCSKAGIEITPVTEEE